MPQLERVGIEPIRGLLRSASRKPTCEIDALLNELQPVCELDRDSETDSFWSSLGSPNVIRIGMKPCVRLHAHAYAAAVVVTAKATPESGAIPTPGQHRCSAAADRLLNWAVGVELTRWLQQQGLAFDLGHVLHAAQRDVPHEALEMLTAEQHKLGQSIFLHGVAWIILHELGHLKLGHTYAEGPASIQQEKDADRFAVDWLLPNDHAPPAHGASASRINALLGISVALLWLTVFNVYIGQSCCRTHPQAYDRLYQVLDHAIDRNSVGEWRVAWDFVATMLFVHMCAAGFEFGEGDRCRMQADPEAEANYLIDRISKRDRAR